MRGLIFFGNLSLISAKYSECMKDLIQICEHLLNFNGSDPCSRMAQYSVRDSTTSAIMQNARN